jgi:transaldolase
MRADVPEEDIIQAGTAAIKKAYAICKARGYEAKLMPAGMRGGYHAEALAGADMSMSLSSGIQTNLAKQSHLVEHIDEPVASETLLRLLTIPEFVRAYELDALPAPEFISYGASQRTLSQFVDAGWGPIGEFEI